MEKTKALNLAHNLLESEFNEFRNNPVGYCEAMGWEENSPSMHLAKKKKETLNFTDKDVNELVSIIQGVDSEDVIDIVESNKVSDFLTNCVAGHIVSFKK